LYLDHEFLDAPNKRINALEFTTNFDDNAMLKIKLVRKFISFNQKNKFLSICLLTYFDFSIMFFAFGAQLFIV